MGRDMVRSEYESMSAIYLLTPDFATEVAGSKIWKELSAPAGLPHERLAGFRENSLPCLVA